MDSSRRASYTTNHAAQPQKPWLPGHLLLVRNISHSHSVRDGGIGLNPTLLLRPEAKSSPRGNDNPSRSVAFPQPRIRLMSRHFRGSVMAKRIPKCPTLHL